MQRREITPATETSTKRNYPKVVFSLFLCVVGYMMCMHWRLNHCIFPVLRSDVFSLTRGLFRQRKASDRRDSQSRVP